MLAVWRPPIGDASFNGPVARQHAAAMPPPAQGLAAGNFGNDVTLRQLLTGVRPGQARAFPDNPYMAGDVGAACSCGRFLSRAGWSTVRIGNASMAESGIAGASAASRDRIDDSAHLNIPASAASSASTAPADQQAFFDVVLKKLENLINLSVRSYAFPPYSLAVSGLAGSRQAAKPAPNSIELIFGRLTENDPVILKIAITHANGFRSVSPIRIFEKPATEAGEAALKERLLSEGAELALSWLTNPLENNNTMIIRTGRAQPYKWRLQIAESLSPGMESAELGARIAAACSVEVAHPGPLDLRKNVSKGFTKGLLARLRLYLVRKLGDEWRGVELFVTGLNGMSANLPNDKTKAYVHLAYTLLQEADGEAKGNVDLLIVRKNENNRCMNASFRHVFVRSEYSYSKTFYGQLLLFGAFAATVGPKNLPDKKAIIHLRGRIAKTLEPPMEGAMLGKALRAYYPLPARSAAVQEDIRLLNSSE